MKYIKLYKTEDAFVEDLFDGTLPLPRVCWAEDTDKYFYGEISDFIKVDSKEQTLLGIDEDTFIILNTF